MRDQNREYGEYCKPKLAELLSCLKLDKQYVKAKGNFLYDEEGNQVADFIGGFGATVLGHNHDALQARIIDIIERNIPIHAQVSVRSESARLAHRLSELTQGNTKYCVNFSNSGTESIEVALKHAYKVHFDRIRREYERLTRILNDFYYRMQEEGEPYDLPVDKTLVDFRDDLDEYNLTQFEDFQNNPVAIALKGSFHGKTSASLKLTFNKSYREPYEGLSSIRPYYVNPDQIENVSEAINDSYCKFLYPVVIQNKVELRPVKIGKVFALIFETIQGEGGIKPLPDKTLQFLADQHKKLGIPYIIDEIQTGCGRTGSFFSYHQTPLRKILPEYICLSKALGGGIVKIGATLIRRDIYDEDFSILHTSTFSEDGFSSEVSMKLIDLLLENNGRIMRNAVEKGDYMQGRLNDLQQRYPRIIKEVRGKGLMIGVELTELKDFSPFFRASGKQGILSMLIASYLLNYHNFRILAPLTTILKGNPGKKRLSVLRLQPPLTVTNELIDKLIDALAEVCEIIECNNEYCLIAHLFGDKVSREVLEQPIKCPSLFPIIEKDQHIDARTGFVVHPTKLEYLRDYYFPSFIHYPVNDNDLLDWWNQISRFLEPVHIKSEYISSNDFVIENSMIFVPYMPKYLTEEKKPFLVQEIRDKIQDAVIVAKELGDDNIPVSIVGLGAYISIATANGLTINDYEMSITTGNAYTTALTVLGIMKAVETKKLPLDKAEVSIFGATGNIGYVIAQILAPRVRCLNLVGSNRKGYSKRLEMVRLACLQEILKTIHNVYCNLNGIGGIGYLGQEVMRVLESRAKPVFIKIYEQLQQTGKICNSIVVEFYNMLLSTKLIDINELIRVGNDVGNITRSDIIILATNSPNPDLITPKMVKDGAIVCNVSVPSNLSREFEQQPNNVLAFDGGLALLPEDSKIDLVGMPRDGMCYGCMAETLLLGFYGHNHSFSKGVINPEKVYKTLEMAHNHGFVLGPLRLNDRVVLT